MRRLCVHVSRRTEEEAEGARVRSVRCGVWSLELSRMSPNLALPPSSPPPVHRLHGAMELDLLPTDTVNLPERATSPIICDRTSSGCMKHMRPLYGLSH